MSTAPDYYGDLTRQHHGDLIAALGPAADALTSAERNILVWLAGWDQSTTEALCGIFRKLREG